LTFYLDENCAEKWKRMRSGYRAQKAKLRRGAPSGSGGGADGEAEVPGWRFWNLMTFLDAFGQNRKSKNNVS